MEKLNQGIVPREGKSEIEVVVVLFCLNLRAIPNPQSLCFEKALKFGSLRSQLFGDPLFSSKIHVPKKPECRKSIITEKETNELGAAGLLKGLLYWVSLEN